jgi:hypothetical protein
MRSTRAPPDPIFWACCVSVWHSKVGLTLDTYSHVLPNMQADAAALVDAALQGAMKKRPGNQN